MVRFSEHFNLGKSQGELDFVDIRLDIDNRLYICPYAIQIREDEWSEACGDHIRSYFNEILDQLRNGNAERAQHLLSHLHEPNETFFGQSSGRPSGRGVGEYKALDLVNALLNSRAFETGLLADVSDAELFIPGVGPDTISDLVTNVIRGLLADYTLAECRLHEIPTSPTTSLGPSWNVVRRDWEAKTYQLPVFEGRPVLLVPWFSVRRRLSLNSQEFYNHYMISYLQSEYLDAGRALVETLKNGRQRVTKKSVKERHPFIKDDMAAFVRDHPEILERYKDLKGASGPLDIEDIEPNFDENALAQVLIDRLREIPTGGDSADTYHSLMVGICTFLFAPDLIAPVKEFEQHNGRKRIDIKFTNASNDGFFGHSLASAQLRARNILIECKNYTKELRNPELDQLAGRFGHQRGFLGFLLCRNMDDRERIIASCRDTAADGRGFMIVFEDRDVAQMLQWVMEGRRSEIDRYLHRRLDEITD
ncbi:hypothetical protein [Novosphingobium mangrovi (ex Huang et al. 2023)]|uniref:Restriction endonuclease type IV Mrr domain-containing protein n=1 Tax=Novosphingobium mangrovi (ex Huang et al. 2023) TaxID=2976432 RepID=A0ABT2IA14_9SPHN|nr:hypothetical protein [Novosphingobium mangrovi (ex Huang et al. 2023)]MCT2401672.1 hypothetical protein [Novosphingobium mangrovi (ex Huang et al. 2023)]